MRDSTVFKRNENKYERKFQFCIDIDNFPVLIYFTFIIFLQVGENGAGKTTLLKILLGELDPVKGHRIGHRNLCIGYFSQHHVDQLDMNLSPVELFAQRYPGINFTLIKSPINFVIIFIEKEQKKKILKFRM